VNKVLKLLRSNVELLGNTNKNHMKDFVSFKEGNDCEYDWENLKKEE